MKGFIKGGKFHPTDTKEKSYRYAKKGSGKSIIPRLGLKLSSERKESFSQIKAVIDRDINLRDKLIDKNEALADKIALDDKSEFNPSRREQLKQNNKVIRDVDNDIKRSINRLSNEEKAQLPDEVQNLRRFL